MSLSNAPTLKFKPIDRAFDLDDIFRRFLPEVFDAWVADPSASFETWCKAP